MDKFFYNDLVAPFNSVSQAAVTLATTNLALYPASVHPVLPANYWAVAPSPGLGAIAVAGGSNLGKAVHLRLVGQITTGATPGNGQWTLYYGSGASATGTILAQSAAFALVASQTNLQWQADIDVHCRATNVVGSATGLLFATGVALMPTVVAAGIVLIPGSAPAVSPGIDLTTGGILSLQFSRSGSTAETMQVHNFQYQALN